MRNEKHTMKQAEANALVDTKISEKFNLDLYNQAGYFRMNPEKRDEILNSGLFPPKAILDMAKKQFIFVRDFDGIPRYIFAKFIKEDSLKAIDGLFLGSNAYINQIIFHAHPQDIFERWYEEGCPILGVTTPQYMAKKDW